MLSTIFFVGSENIDNNILDRPTDSNDGGLFSQAQIDFILDQFGYEQPEILQEQSDLLNEIGCNVTVKIYDGVGHDYEWNDSQMKKDVFAFFAQQIESSTGDGDDSNGGGGGGCYIDILRYQ